LIRSNRFGYLNRLLHVEILAMAQFSNLPVELVDAILQALCLGCTPPEDDGCHTCYSPICCCSAGSPADNSRVAALAALCLTSRQLNSLATVHLYHRPICDDRMALLARTLLARKDLALLVKDLRVGEVQFDPSQLDPETAAHFTRQFQAYQDGLSDDERESAGPDRLPLGQNGQLSHESPVTIDIMSSLCPNLKTLHATLGYFEGFRLCTPQSMPHLQTVTISHSDTELGIDLATAIPLFRAAPNITRMAFYMIAGCSDLGGVTLDKVTSLDFQNSSFSSDALTLILTAFPNLETFKYECGGASVGYDQFTLREAKAAFLAHAPKLNLVRLAAMDRTFDDLEWADDAAVRGLESALAARGTRLEFDRSW
jgi:hypothetical protein